MKGTETLRTALEAIGSRRMRSALTVLGILIGIASVMLTVGLGQGASAAVTARISALGSNLLVVTPGSTTVDGVRGGFGSATTLTTADAAVLADKTVAPDIAAVAPVASSSLSLANGSTTWSSSVTGTTTDWLDVRARTVQYGRFFTADEQTRATPVAVLGVTTADELFGYDAPIGQTFTANGQTLTVIGILNSAGTSGTGNEDDMVIVPLTTYTQRIAGSSSTRLSSIYLGAASGASLSAAYQEATNALLTSHHVTTATADFSVASQEALLQTVTSTTQIFTVLLAGIAAISLLVGGIGVMNIMLVSVTERIREIGLRKALGATPGVIQRQFLVEASVLGLIGGLLGLALGVLGAVVLPHFISQEIVISPIAAGGALIVSVGIGVIAGVYPARRAAKLAPIDALRSE